MGVLDANPPLPEFRDDYVLQEVDRDWLSKAVKPKQFIHIDQSECIMCEGCVDICPWKYPATIIDSPNRIHARNDSISGMVGLGLV